MNRQGFEPSSSTSETGAIIARTKYYTETLAIKTKTRQISPLNMQIYIERKISRAGLKRFVIFRPYLNMEGKSSTQHERFFHAYLPIVRAESGILNLKFFVTKSLQICRRMRLK